MVRTVDLKRRLLVLMVAVLVGAPTTALAASGAVSKPAIPEAAIGPAHDGGNPGDNADNPGEASDPGEAANPGDNGDSPGDNANDAGDDGSCTSAGSTAPAAGPVTVCPGRQTG